MKPLIALLALLVAGWLAWTHLRPFSLDGNPVPEATRVVHVRGDAPFDPSDRLQPGVWTLVAFTSGQAEADRDLMRRLEVAIRERHPAVRLVLVHAHDREAAAAQQHRITEFPTLWLFEGYRNVSTNRATIERALLKP